MYLFIKGILKTLDQFIDCMISDLDFDYRILDLSCQEDIIPQINKIDKEIDSDSVVITFNNVGIGLSANGRNYWALKKVTFFNILVDHPFHYREGIEEFNFPGLHFACIDSSHVDFLKTVFPERKDSFFFLPHGGTALNLSLFREKTNDILYVGSVPPPLNCDDKRNDELLKIFYDFADSYFSRERYPEMHIPVIDFLNAISIPLDKNNVYSFTCLLAYYTTYQTSIRRINLIKALCDNGFRVTVYGSGVWEELSREYPPDILEYKGFISPEKCVEEISRSKITINDTLYYTHGTHERVFNGMYNGSVVLTNPSVYIENRFNDMEEILVWDGKNISEAVSKISAVLSDEDYRCSIVSKAYSKLDHDTWSDRAKYLISYAKELKQKGEA